MATPPPAGWVAFAPAHLGSAPFQRKIEETQLATAFAELCPFGNRIVSDLRYRPLGRRAAHGARCKPVI